MKSRYIVRFSASERLAHWVQFAAFMALLVTGLPNYSRALRAFAEGRAGQTSRVWHRVAAIVYIASPFIYLFGNPRAFFFSLKEAFTWNRDDRVWLSRAWSYYAHGEVASIPPQGKYNAGQKLNALLQIVAYSLFGITGLVMWFKKKVVSPAAFAWSMIIHDLASIANVCMVMLHVYLVAIHPLTRESILSMFEGVVSREYAEEHHAKWLAERDSETLNDERKKEG